MNTDTRQAEWTKLTAGCGHETAARLSVNAKPAAVEISQLMSNPCIRCAKAARTQTRGICWSDESRGR